MAEMHNAGQYYVLEARELLQKIEQKLMELERNPADRELLDELFRAFHTIKGSGSMFGYTAVADFTHEIESLFDLLREGKLQADSQLIDTALEAKDFIGTLLEEGSGDEEHEQQLREAMRAFSMRGERDEPSPDAQPHAAGDERTPEGVAPDEMTGVDAEQGGNAVQRIYRILFRPRPELFLRGAKVLPLLNELSELGEAAVFAHTERVPELEQLEPESLYCSWTILLDTRRERNAIADVFIFVEEYAEISIELLDEEREVDLNAEYKRIGEILQERGDISGEDIDTIIAHSKRFGDTALQEGLVPSSALKSALEEQKMVRRARSSRSEQRLASTIRVGSGKLDTLVDLVGELVTLQARLSRFGSQCRMADTHERHEMELLNENLERLTTNLRDATMHMRMVPLAETFNSFQRLVRDLSKELGKEVRLETDGAETELDKHIIDALADPLMHIVRNAIDHGLETPQEREAHGKQRQGSLSIHADYSGGQVRISVQDDGAGVDPEKVRERAVARGMLSPGDRPEPEEILNLLFRPGFSTAENTTSVSGRGVGMDVVKREIERLRGKVGMVSEPGVGSTVTLTIPLTLSIIDGLLVGLGDERYVVNLSAVEECFELSEEMRSSNQSQSYLTIRGRVIPFIDLRRLFGEPESGREIRELVVVRSGEQRVALIVDQIIGQHQTVVKPMSGALRGVEEVSGSTILGDGNIAFILDTNKMMELSVG
jgi:two-component system chemotaxis sensor kinase CheA